MYVARIIHYVECVLIIQKASQIIRCRHSGVGVKCEISGTGLERACPFDRDRGKTRVWSGLAANVRPDAWLTVLEPRSTVSFVLLDQLRSYIFLRVLILQILNTKGSLGP